MKRLLVLALFTFSSLAQVADDAAIRKILADRIDAQKGVGIVVGVIEPGGRRVVSSKPLNGDTVFEIGSATKVFTSLLLADMVQRGEVALADPVAKYLPAEVKVPERNGKKITLQHLAQHTSGLPYMPSNFMPKDAANPFADYTVKQLYEALAAVQLASDPGEHYDYSNLGVGLLGHVLARRAGTDYETLVCKRILVPLGMKNTSITLSKEMKARLATGHDDDLAPAANWDLPTFAGAGALRSTANDMLTFLAAALDSTKSPLRQPMQRMLSVERHSTAIPSTAVALGWHVTKSGDRELVWHNGQTGGYHSYLGYDPKARSGVVVLSNSSKSIDDIGRHLLDPGVPVEKILKVDSKLLERYVGRYELVPNFILTITREGDRLFLQATGQPKFELFAESETKFFLKVVDAQVVFEVDAEGRVPSLVLHQNGENRARRLEGEAPKPKEWKEVAVDPKIFAGYVGRYQLAPAFVLDVTTDGKGLFVQATGQQKLQVYPSGETEFFYKVVDAQITFVTDDRGRATSLVLHQNGINAPGKRID